MKIQVVNKTSTAGHQEQERRKKNPEVSTIFVFEAYYQERYKCHFTGAKEKTPAQKQPRCIRKPHA